VRVLLMSQVFPPELHPSAVMVDQLAEHLSKLGARVAIAAGYPHHPHGILLGGYRRSLLRKEKRGGFEVRRGWHWISRSPRIPSRAAVMVSQALGRTLAGAGWGPVDVVVDYGPPLVGPLFSAALAAARGARFVPVIYDLYPDVAVETGKVRNGLVIGAARAAERLVYGRADRVVVLSEGFRRALVGRGVPRSKVAVVPVWLDAREIVPSPRTNAWRREVGVDPTTKVILYAGTIGLVSGAAILIAVAASMRERSEALFLMVGEGQVKEEIEREARRRGLRNLRFLPLQPRERLNEVQAAADVSLVTLAPGRGRTSVPSKIVGYMAAGRPIVASVDADSDTAAAVREGACGIVTPPGDPAALAAAISSLLDDAARREEMGRAARSYFETTYSKDAALAAMTAVLEDVTGAAGHRRGADEDRSRTVA
jgi:putative colanic acid biosynthesis glycosyltransferase WcaI